MKSIQVERHLHNPLRDEDGYMMVELITAATLSVIILATFGVLLLAGGKHEPEISQRSMQLERGRVAAEQMTRELRAGYQVIGSSTASRLSFNTFAPSTNCGLEACRVTYSCGSTSCTRTESRTDGTGASPAAQVVAGIASASVFSYTPSPTAPSHVAVTLRFPGDAEDGESVTVSDGAEFRNDR